MASAASRERIAIRLVDIGAIALLGSPFLIWSHQFGRAFGLVLAALSPNLSSDL